MIDIRGVITVLWLIYVMCLDLKQKQAGDKNTPGRSTESCISGGTNYFYSGHTS